MFQKGGSHFEIHAVRLRATKIGIMRVSLCRSLSFKDTRGGLNLVRGFFAVSMKDVAKTSVPLRFAWQHCQPLE